MKPRRRLVPGTVKSLSVVIPARNEEVTLPALLDELQPVLSELKKSRGLESEIIVVDDHSTDKTAALSRARGAKVVANQGPNGKGAALRAGFDASTGEVLVMMDADGSHVPDDIPLFLAFIEKGYGLVVGSRSTGGSDEYTLTRLTGNVLLTGAFLFMSGVFVSDALNGFKAFRRDVYTCRPYTANEFEIEIELLFNALRQGYRIGEFPSHEKERAGGEMKSKTMRHGFRFLFRILKEGAGWRFSRPTAA